MSGIEKKNIAKQKQKLIVIIIIKTFKNWRLVSCYLSTTTSKKKTKLCGIFSRFPVKDVLTLVARRRYASVS